MTPEAETSEGDVGERVVASHLVEGLSLRRFALEMDHASTLDEPHIARVLTTGVRRNGVLFYTVPRVQGDTLRTRLDGGPMPEQESIKVLREIAIALAYAHGRGSAHGDLQPSKIVLSFGTAIVMDFGVARALRLAHEAGWLGLRDGHGDAVSNPMYESPEVRSGGLPDASADIYAWGVIAYEMLSGMHPFAGLTPNRLPSDHPEDMKPSHLLLRAPDVPAALSELVMQAMANDPRVRPTASDLVRVLGDPRALESPETPDLTREGQPTRKRTALNITLCLLAAAMAFGGPRIVAKIRALTGAVDLTNAGADANRATARTGAAEARLYVRAAADTAKVRDSLLKLAIATGRLAVAADSTVGEAHLVLGDALAASMRFGEAMPHFERALLVMPNDAEAQAHYARNLLAAGSISDALEAARHAAQASPMSAAAVNLVALALMDSRRFPEALAQADLARTMDTSFLAASRTLGRAALFFNRPDSAIAAVEPLYTRSPSTPGVRALLMMSYAAAGRTADAQRVRDEILTSLTTTSEYDIMVVGLVFGDRAAAIGALERSVASGHDVATLSESLGCDPLFDPLKSDDRYLALLLKLGVTSCPASTMWPIAARP